MGTCNFRWSNMVAIGLDAVHYDDDEVMEEVNECYPEWVEEWVDEHGEEGVGYMIMAFRERLDDMERDELADQARLAKYFGEALADEMAFQFPFNRALREVCDDWGWSFSIESGYYSGFQLVLDKTMDTLWEEDKHRPMGSDRRNWHYYYELVQDDEQYKGLKHQDFERALRKIWNFGQYALRRFAKDWGYQGTSGGWFGDTYELSDADEWASSEKELAWFEHWYNGVILNWKRYLELNSKGLI